MVDVTPEVKKKKSRSLSRIDGKAFQQENYKYFSQHPTVLREYTEDSKIAYTDKDHFKHNFFKRKIARASVQDTEIYDLKSCIHSHSQPRFGYGMLDFGETQSGFKVGSVYDRAVAYERERHIEAYMNRCFEIGRSVRRSIDKGKQVDRVAHFKKQFNRIGLIRDFFNQDRENDIRKWDEPIDDCG